jgi:serine/threonine protein kinase/tetratricopeptide (TPR) repeat protein
VSDGSFPALDKERWLRLSRLLDHGLELGSDDRAAWLLRLHAEDGALADAVSALLARHERLERERFLEEPAALPPTASSLSGMVVGAYTLRTPLGQGGMGSVWLADRSDGRFTGQAAVKLLNASLIGHDGEARFRREASILARLRHANIARLIDAGLSPLGQPYIVLEHVDGLRIDRYCESRHLGVPERIRLFLEVLDAVAHAHANLIVHRDLKPQNVLVDSDGRARLLDFGIAKLIDPDPGERATVTRAGESALTPEFAAPEQVTGGDITTATDVYSLGVLLCALLTGRHPAGSFPTTPAEWIRTIVDVEARPMSDLAAESSPAKHAGALRGDLDNIVARALHKKPEERYPSVEAFADDLRRHLRHEPVTARPDTLTYRASRLVRRHPAAVASAALAIVAAAVFTAGIAWQAREARLQRDEAKAQMARATAAREFMGFLLSVASSPGSAHRPGDLLEKGEALIGKEYAESEPLQAEMLVAVGRQYMASERYEKATPVLERAAELAGRSGDPALLARALCPLAFLRMIKGQGDDANKLMERALDGLPADSLHAIQRAECLIDRGSFGFLTEQAEAMKRDGAAALAILDTIPAPPASKRIDALAVLAYGYYLARESREADAGYAELMKELKRTGRDETLLAADTCNNWALVHYLGDIAKAEPLCRRAVELRRSIEGADAIAPSVTFNHAGVLLQLARFDEAEPLFEETIRTARARHEERIETDAMLELADLYIETGNLARASAQLATLGPLLTGPRPDPRRQVQMAYYQARLALAQGDAATAQDKFASIVDVFEKRKSRIGLFVFALNGLARARVALGDAAAGATAAGRAIEVATSFVEPGTSSYLIGLSKLALGDTRLAVGDRGAARAPYREALDHLGVTLGKDHPATAAARRGLAASGGP